MFNKDDIEKAKSVPWTTIFDVGHNKVRVNCPFHEDDNPAMDIKLDKAHCFVCNQSWDKIDVVRQIHKLSFTEAVNILLTLCGALFSSRQPLPLTLMETESNNFIFDESGGYQMKEPNVGKWFIPDSWREEFKELRRSRL